ncbi:hypothetical protein LA76x_2097 [Lysobacter antibioticus]|uniref:Uncharacterized protein n=1 Tax=Lysobacter antibioticus TaxID=84531 RepID=A0A0S2F9M5_LYSAN|nr:hypothetical protein LA76x_2097 [Lysobacter antibioticus]
MPASSPTSPPSPTPKHGGPAPDPGKIQPRRSQPDGGPISLNQPSHPGTDAEAASA